MGQMNARRVLTVDDRSQTREGLKALLATAPPVQTVGEAADGREALHLVAVWQPDVVLMDASMPVMDGLEATRLITARWPAVRVIVLTIHTGLRADALAAGADGFLVKGCTARRAAGCNPGVIGGKGNERILKR